MMAFIFFPRHGCAERATFLFLVFLPGVCGLSRIYANILQATCDNQGSTAYDNQETPDGSGDRNDLGSKTRTMM